MAMLMMIYHTNVSKAVVNSIVISSYRNGNKSIFLKRAVDAL